ncbi:hypothetical protein [Streptomyces specialis]|uniref:hypothetical protein n=1 Tax=Streptomyces specialis TaxID=498367 RepID=UPI00131CB12F|nr:hypothetical protein [Streptomyces specialis]
MTARRAAPARRYWPAVTLGLLMAAAIGWCLVRPLAGLAVTGAVPSVPEGWWGR